MVMARIAARLQLSWLAVGLVSSPQRDSVFPGKKIRYFVQPRFPISTEFRFLCDNDDGQTGSLEEGGGAATEELSRLNLASSSSLSVVLSRR
ncbi:hypothetical protein BGZ57DRAFT_125532 [Hyaloscypha finlandica]|nr:hypothetical protein BGZ57DRAFT_125532 [Hyaloscypha finlandica]